MLHTGAGIYITHSDDSVTTGTQPNNSLVVVKAMSELEAHLKIDCMSNTSNENGTKELIRPDNRLVNSDNPMPSLGLTRTKSFFRIENTNNEFTAEHQGVYTCRIADANGMLWDINIGIYPSGFRGMFCNISLTWAVLLHMFTFPQLLLS